VAPAGVIVAQSVCAIVAVFVLYVHTFCQPYPKAEDKSFNAVAGPFGRWIYLTRQTLALQAVHFFMSFIGPFFSVRMTYGTYIMALFLDGLGLFVTVQFFSLVAPNAEYIKMCGVWARRGVDLKATNNLTHIPAGCLAFMDILVLKSKTLLIEATPTITVLVLVALVYVVFYLTIITVNFWVTSRWPYEFMDSLGTNLFKWARFVAAQVIIILIFVFIMVALSNFGPSAW